MILEAKDECNTLSFTWTSDTTRSWNIQISQISCTADWKPPDGCMQYFTGITGYIYSYNYAGSYHLASQQYTNCIRTEQGYCSIGYAATSTTDFGMSLVTPTASPSAISASADSCTQDYVIIAGGGASAGATTNYDRFCGSLLLSSPGSTDTSLNTIYTNKMPFQLGFYTDATEVDATSGTEWSKGFCIYYKQTACS